MTVGPDPSQKYELSADRSVLTIKKVQKPGDSCAIMCKAGNVIFDSIGNDMYSEKYADATLRIIGKLVYSVVWDQLQPALWYDGFFLIH